MWYTLGIKGGMSCVYISNKGRLDIKTTIMKIREVSSDEELAI